MRRYTLLVLVALLSHAICYTQENFQLTGKTISNGIPVEHVHLVNLSSSIGTISSEKGFFTIEVEVGDSILVSSLAHQRMVVKITKDIQQEKILTISLTPKIEELDEIRFTGLTGNLKYDLELQPEDSIPEMGWNYSSDDLKTNFTSNIDPSEKRVNAENFVNPIPGGGATVGLPDKQLIREQRLKRTLKLKKDFPDKLIKEFGISYFTVTLGIKQKNIPHFISFCEAKDLFEKYRSNNILEVIEILKEESNSYHELQD